MDGQTVGPNIYGRILSQSRDSKAYELFQNGSLIIANAHIHGSLGTLNKSWSLTLVDPRLPFDDPMYQSITELDIFVWEFLYSFWCQLTFSQLLNNGHT